MPSSQKPPRAAAPSQRSEPPRSLEKNTRATLHPQDPRRTFLPPIVVQGQSKAQTKTGNSSVRSPGPSSRRHASPVSSWATTGDCTTPHDEPPTPPSSRNGSPQHQHRPSVHFSARHPLVLHHKGEGSASASASASACAPCVSCPSSSLSSPHEEVCFAWDRRPSDPTSREGSRFTEKNRPGRGRERCTPLSALPDKPQGRAESYRFFQGRNPGVTKDELRKG
ncbi:hypothetical protein E4U13_001308 [Claviceps humidiphila]|uniref:Uncharacterized protein n=1 Tax=Claviceps humidiphila TaxID=1294629 RepID=A0A9P7Q9X5_9HYPO|nr:hypothetical protein E4U13_001308 [Claviceps humidiphila]